MGPGTGRGRGQRRGDWLAGRSADRQGTADRHRTQWCRSIRRLLDGRPAVPLGGFPVRRPVPSTSAAACGSGSAVGYRPAAGSGSAAAHRSRAGRAGVPGWRETVRTPTPTPTRQPCPGRADPGLRWAEPDPGLGWAEPDPGPVPAATATPASGGHGRAAVGQRTAVAAVRAAAAIRRRLRRAPSSAGHPDPTNVRPRRRWARRDPDHSAGQAVRRASTRPGTGGRDRRLGAPPGDAATWPGRRGGPGGSDPAGGRPGTIAAVGRPACLGRPAVRAGPADLGRASPGAVRADPRPAIPGWPRRPPGRSRGPRAGRCRATGPWSAA